jgi:primosomal protein N' (replication factor Y) (superfamily II helicase)
MEKNKKLIYANIQILSFPIDELTYKFVKTNEQIDIQTGNIVKVPLKNKIKVGIVKSISFNKPSFKVKKIKEIIQLDNKFRLFIKILSNKHLTNQITFLKRTFGLSSLKTKTDYVNKTQNDKPKSISEEQEKIFNQIIENFDKAKTIRPTFIFGGHNSGKIDLSIELIKHQIQNKKSVIVLCQSKEDTSEFKKKLNKTIDECKITLQLDKKKENNYEQEVIIGTQSPVFTTTKNIGMYVVINEHSENYNEKTYPFISSKDTLILRARIENVPIILTSPTPSIESWHKIKNGRFNFYNLNTTHSNKTSKIKHIHLNAENTVKESRWVSKYLYNSINKTIEDNKICVLIINRKGIASNIRCSQCNTPAKCNICGYYYSLYEYNICICHKCKNKSFISNKCMECKSTNCFYKNSAIGTIQVEKIIKQLFQNAKTKLIDASIKENLEKIKKEIYEKKINIIIGTDTTSKLIKIPDVKTIGMICGDLPQRAGIDSTGNIIRKAIEFSKTTSRSSKKEIIIQTILKSQEFGFLSNTNEDFSKYCNFELKFRKENQYPPFGKTCIIAVFDKLEDQAQHKAKMMQSQLSETTNSLYYKTLVKVILKNRNGYCFLIYGKSNSSYYLKDNFKKAITRCSFAKTYAKFLLKFNRF